MKRTRSLLLCLFLAALLVFAYLNIPRTPSPDDVPVEPVRDHYTVEDIKALKNTELFAEDTIEHIFFGTVSSKGKASGYHYDRVENTPGEIIEGTRTKEDEHGVYTAQVRVNGIDKTGNSGYSTFYPDSYSPQEVIDAINEAYANKEKLRGDLYAGLTEKGIEIDMALDKNGLIVTAYPIKEE